MPTPVIEMARATSIATPTAATITTTVAIGTAATG
jgi:hypothetical protein